MAVEEIPFFDLKRQVDRLLPELQRVIMDALGRGQFVLGDSVEILEEKVSQFVDAQSAVAVASGTDGLILALKAIGVGPGDAVITTPFTFFSTASSIVRCGARPLFVDIDSKTCNIDAAKVEALIQDECYRNENGELKHTSSGAVIRGIMPVHLFGQMADMEPLTDIAEREGLFVLEDAAQAFGAAEKGNEGNMKMAGSIGEAGVFSFYPTKNLGAFGDAGMVVTSKMGIAERVKLLRVHGSSERDIFDEIGFCSRMDTIQAAVLLAKLPYIDDWNKKRHELALNYIERIQAFPWAEQLELPLPGQGKRHIYHQFVLRSKIRDKVLEYLRQNGVGCGVYYSRPLHLQPALRCLNYKKGDLPESEKAADEAFALPIWPELTEDEQDRVANILNLFYNRVEAL